jgi:hypothetical protein
MKQYIQKSISVLIISLFVGQQTVFAVASVVTDPGNTATNVITTVEQTLSTSTDFTMKLKEFGLDAVAYSLAAQMGKRMSNMILNKATGGASGDKPEQYVTSFTDLLQQKNNTEVRKYVAQLDALSGKNPFAANIAKSLTRQSQDSNNALDTSLTKFNLDKVVGSDWKNFKNDVKVGGWNGYIFSALPQNNPYGASILVAEDIARKTAFEQEAEKLKLVSPGINPTANAKCDLKISKYQRQLKNQVGQIKTNTGTRNQGTEILAQKKQLELEKQKLQGQVGSSSNVSDIDTKISLLNNRLIELGLDQNTGVNLAAAGTAGLIDSAGNIDDCISDIITSPSSATSALIDSALTYGIEKSQNSQGWKDMLLTTFMTMTQSFLRNGGLSLFKSSGVRMATSIPTFSTGGIEDLVDSNGNARSWYDQPDQIIDLPNDFPMAYSFSKSEIDTLKQTLDQFNVVPGLFSELEQCIPGPDIGYSARIEDYYNEKIEKLNRWMQKDGRAWFVDWYGRKADDLDKSKDTAINEMRLYVTDPKFNIPGYSIFKSTANEYDPQKTKYQEIKRQYIDRQASLSNILALNAEIKDRFNEEFIKTQQDQFRDFGETAKKGLNYDTDTDKLVFSKKDWDALKDDPERKKQLVEWAKSFEK